MPCMVSGGHTHAAARSARCGTRVSRDAICLSTSGAQAAWRAMRFAATWRSRMRAALWCVGRRRRSSAARALAHAAPEASVAVRQRQIPVLAAATAAARPQHPPRCRAACRPGTAIAAAGRSTRARSPLIASMQACRSHGQAAFHLAATHFWVFLSLALAGTWTCQPTCQLVAALQPTALATRAATKAARATTFPATCRAPWGSACQCHQACQAVLHRQTRCCSCSRPACGHRRLLQEARR